MEMQVNKLTSEEFGHWHDVLETRRTAIMSFEDDLKKQALEDLSPETAGEISRVRLHSADLATDTQEVEKLEILSERNIRSLHEIESAMERLRNGVYGLCQNCGELISHKRLEALPEARFCLECEKEFEAMPKQFSPQRAIRMAPFPVKIAEELAEVFVSDIMQADPIKMNINENLEEAARILSENNFRHIPVVDDVGDIQGIISDRDLLRIVLRVRATGTQDSGTVWSHRKVGQIMTKTPETVTPNTKIVEAATILLENKISSLPVVEDNQLVGIITESDFVKLVTRS